MAIFSQDRTKSYTENLQNYLYELGFVDNPMETAPNAEEIPESERKETGENKNPTYEPSYTTEQRSGDSDTKIVNYINSFLRRKNHDRSEEKE